MSIDAIDSATFIQDAAIGEEIVKESFEDKASETSSLVQKCMKNKTFSHCDSLKPAIVLCREKETNSSSDNQKGEWHGGYGGNAKMDEQGKKSLNFDAHQEYKDQNSGSSTRVRESISVDEKGKVSGQVGVDHTW